MFDPTVGRWFEEDPEGLDAGPNLYEYVGNSPTNATDPSGLWIVTRSQGDAEIVKKLVEWWVPGITVNVRKSSEGGPDYPWLIDEVAVSPGIDRIATAVAANNNVPDSDAKEQKHALLAALQHNANPHVDVAVVNIAWPGPPHGPVITYAAGVRNHNPTTEPMETRLAGVKVSSKDNFYELSQSKDAYNDYLYAMKMGIYYYPPNRGWALKMRIARPRNPAGGIFQLNTLGNIPGRQVEYPLQNGERINLVQYPIRLNDGGGPDKQGTWTSVYLSSGTKPEQQYICHSLTLHVGGPGYMGTPLVVNQDEADGIFRNPAFFAPVKDTDPIKVGDVLLFYAIGLGTETPFHSSEVTKVPPLQGK